MKTKIRNSISGLLLIPLLLACFALSPRAQAVVPAPDGGYPNWNTAEGTNALFHLTTGIYNTALGGQALFSNTGAGYNTAVGLNALYHNTGNYNTANGAFALFSNTTGTQNTATGVNALRTNTGSFNTANGANTLYRNTTGVLNTATGARALFNNTMGHGNTANGYQALLSNTQGNFNTATGEFALFKNTTGDGNTAYGDGALSENTTGSGNFALGFNAGFNVTTANNVICIGNPGQNLNNSCYIGSIFGQASSGGTAVLINSNGKLGTTTSSRRFKEEIKPMERASEALFALKPVTFRYKNAIDPQGIPQFGLVAEEVEEVNPDLVVHDGEGKVNTVRYDAVNAMLLNEFLKEHRTVQEQQKQIDALKAELKEQRALIQKVSDKVELSRPAPQMAENNQ